MLSTIKMRNQVIKLSAYTQLNPDYYFIQGYIMGIGANPNLIQTSQWLKDLFGDIEFTEEEQADTFQALMQLYNLQMEKIIELEIKLPTKCVLSKKDFEGSLATDAPLPNWCLGMLKALKLLDEKLLTEDQSNNLIYTRNFLNTFSSLENVKNIDFLTEGYEVKAHQMKRFLSTSVHNLIFILRFSQDDKPSMGSDNDHHQEDQTKIPHDEFNEMMRFVMTESSAAVDHTIESMLAMFESEYTEQYLAEQKGHIWFDHEARPYMILRARRAQLNFERGDISLAIDELQALLELNPHDNQANRYPLANYLVLQKRWSDLEKLLTEYDEDSTFMLASKALMLFSQQGDSPEAIKVKKQLKKANKYLEKYLTGQAKAPKNRPEMYSQGDKTEVFIYLSLGGKETWRSVEGALFWLRRK